LIYELKIITAVLVVVGAVVGFINNKLSPDAILLESSPERPEWLPWLSWILSSLAAILYIVLDFIE
jgi:uncharacterized protein involved in cysteine biosynthesis